MSYILSYELADNPGHEYEQEVPSLDDANLYLQTLPEHMIVWYDITDDEGNTVYDWRDTK